MSSSFILLPSSFPLALAWLPSLAIGGAVLAAGPVIIHIIFRWRYREIEFAALRFLLVSLKRSKQRLRLEELIIIGLRVLACVLIGLLLSNIRAESIVPGRAAPTAHIFILDDSLSMGQQVGTSTLFQKATAHLAERLRLVGDSDMVAILSACRPEDHGVLPRLSLVSEVRREDFLRRLAAMKPTDLRARFPEALAAAASLAGKQAEMPVRLHVLSDFRKAEFAENQSAESVRRAFASLPTGRTQVALLDFGLPCRNNLTVESVRMVDRLAVANAGTLFRVNVRNNGLDAVEGSTATVQLGTVVLPAVSLGSIAPGELVSREFTYVLPSAGFAAVTVSVGGDSLAGDDRAACAFAVREFMRVLVVDGGGTPSARGSAAFCLAHAIDPSGQGTYGQRVETLELQSLGEGDLDGYDAVILANVGRFPAGRDDSGRTVYPQLAALQRYVHSGGGLAVFLGDRTDFDFAREVLQPPGLCPLRLIETVPPLPDGKSYVRISPDSVAADPMLRLFAGDGEKFTRLVRFHGYIKAAETDSAEVLARFDDKDRSPAVVRTAAGKGTVVVWCTSPDIRWTDWPKDMSFLGVINDMTWQLIRRRDDALDGPVGRPLTLAIPPELADASVTLKTPAYPAEDIQTLQPRGQGRQRTVEHAPALHSGLYEMLFALPDRSTRTVWFSRGIDPAEGNLDKATEQEIAAAVGLPHSYHGNLAVQSAVEREPGQRRSYHWIFLAMLMGVLGLEVLLARRFGHYAQVSDGHA